MTKLRIIFKGKVENSADFGCEYIEGIALMRDGFDRVFISDPFFKLGEKWIKVIPESLCEKRDDQEFKKCSF